MVWRVLLGRLPSGNQGLRVSKPGFDVFAASPEQLIFDSESPDWGQVMMVAAFVPVSNTTTIPFPAGLAVAPYVTAGMTLSSSGEYSEWSLWAFGTPTIVVTNTYVQVTFPGGSGTPTGDTVAVGLVAFTNRGGQ